MTEEIAKEPSPEVVQEESGPDGIFDDDVDVPQAGLEPGQPDRREVAGHPNALDEGQAGDRKHTKHWHQNSQHQKKELSMNYTTPISSHGARNVSWDKGETSLTEGKKSQRST